MKNKTIEEFNPWISFKDLVEHLEFAFETQSRNALISIPKTDLHTHGWLSGPLEIYQKLAKDDLAPLPVLFKDFKDFYAYIINELRPVIQKNGLKGIREVIKAGLRRTASEGVIYAEMSFDISSPLQLGISLDEYIQAINEEINIMSPQLRVCPEIGIDRAFPPKDILPFVEMAISSGVFKAIDLYGDEQIRSSKEFIEIFRLAEDRGLKLKAHVGEIGDAKSIKDTVEDLHLHAVQHGIRAVEDPDVINFLAKRDIILNICTNSNYKLGIVKSLEEHPLPTLLRKGIRVTVNTDDFTLFNAGVCDELLVLRNNMGLTCEEIARVIWHGIEEIPK